jgi:acetyl-CoA carboxylase biotin carboxylase subunit
MLEEAPCPVLSADLRKEICQAALALARQVQYESAGTIEFILDQEKGKFYFLEMNTRIQVEHPVTEMITGIDIVQTQIRVAAGEKLPFRQRDIAFKGHAIECRINAEHPYKFTPSPGRITSWHAPGGPGIRVDSHAFANYVVPPYYDSLVGKVIAYGDTRAQAIARMRVALSEMVVEGIQTNLPLHQEIMLDSAFIRGGTNIHYLEHKLGLAKKAD